MKTNCKIIQDLLPLYSDGILSEESKTLIEEHLSECEICKAIAERTKNVIICPDEASENLKSVKPFKRLKKSRARTLIITISISMVMFFLSFGVLLPYFDPLLSTYNEFLGISQTRIISGNGYTKSLIKMIAEKENWNESEIECKEADGVMTSAQDGAFGFQRWITYQDDEYMCSFEATRNFFGIYKIKGYDIASYNSETDIWVFKYSGNTFKTADIPEG